MGPQELVFPVNVKKDNIVEGSEARGHLRGTSGDDGDGKEKEYQRINLQYIQASPVMQQYNPNNPAHVAYAQQYAAAAAAQQAQQAQQYAAAGYMPYQPQMGPAMATAYGQ